LDEGVGKSAALEKGAFLLRQEQGQTGPFQGGEITRDARGEGRLPERLSGGNEKGEQRRASQSDVKDCQKPKMNNTATVIERKGGLNYKKKENARKTARL